MPCVAPLQAGARSLVVTLWEINDLATAEIMEAFYEIRDTGAGKVEALGKAIAQSGRRRSDLTRTTGGPSCSRGRASLRPAIAAKILRRDSRQLQQYVLGPRAQPNGSGLPQAK
jgi:hypothetical protein